MKTRQDCFAELRRLFIESNPVLMSKIEHEANDEAAALGLNRSEFISTQINQEFGNYLNRLNGDTTVTVIKMMVQNEMNQENLLKEYYQEIADSLLMSLDDFLKSNRITL